MPGKHAGPIARETREWWGNAAAKTDVIFYKKAWN